MWLVSGLSGAGKSTVLDALEDMGFFCTDNLPLDLLQDWARQVRSRRQPAAVCVDVRSAVNMDDLYETVQATIASDEAWRFLFVEASDEVLLRRFSTLRRRHPLAVGENLLQTIARERASMLPLRDLADIVLDTSDLTPHELGTRLEALQADNGTQYPRFTVMSFSYRHGLPPDADMVIDVRCLPNPYYQESLASQTGRDQAVIDFLASSPEVTEMERRIQDWLAFTQPLLRKERKKYFTLAFGCSGGRHRSVYMAERIARWLRQQGLASPTIHHRELGLLRESDKEA